MFYTIILIFTIFTSISSDDQNGSRIETFVKNLINHILQQPETVSLFDQLSKKLSNSTCLDKLKLIGNFTDNKSIQRMLDATAKPQSGILSGNIMHIGNYDQCLQLNAKYCSAVFDFHPVYGQGLKRKILQFMTGGVNLNTKHEDMKKSYGFCVPKECKAADLQIIANITENAVKLPLHFTFQDSLCHTQDPQPFTNEAIGATVFFTIFIAIIISSTLYDAIHHDKSQSLSKCFSLIENFKKLTSDASSGELKCLNGIRVISMMWMVLIHRYASAFMSPNINTFYIFEWKIKVENIFVLAASFSVETFFTISGLLVTYSYLNQRRKLGDKTSFVRFYLHRILRLSPSLAFLILLVISSGSYFGNGPFWPFVDKFLVRDCRDYWWSTLLYIQNYYNPTSQCIPQAWYLAVDTQLYFLTPIVLIPISKFPKTTIIAILALVLVQSAYVFWTIFQNSLPATFFDLDDRFVTQVYMPTHMRITPYLVGILCGYYIFNIKTNPLKLRKHLVVFFWTLSLSCLLGLVFSHVPFLEPTYTPLQSALFTASTRTLWALGLSVVIVLCVSGYGGVINSFLSIGAFSFLIRLNYAVYLLHEIEMAFIMTQGRASSYFSNLYLLHEFWGHYIILSGLAIVWTLMVESPVMALEQFFTKRQKVTRL